MKLIERIKNWLFPQSIYIVVAYNEETERFAEIIPVYSLEKATEIESVLRKTYGGRNVSKASRNIDDVPYLIQRKLLVNSIIKEKANASNS